jgi:hypothetical protein
MAAKSFASCEEAVSNDIVVVGWDENHTGHRVLKYSKNR